MRKPLFKAGQDWTPELLATVWEEIVKVGAELKVSYYPPQIEIVSAKQMLDAYTSTGMPVMYRHWSFGKEFVFSEEQYLAGKMGLAYELVINSTPCIAYLMEENDMVLQTLVMAHASIGHSAVFKNNYLFKANTDASSIVDYLNFAKNFIKMCEEKYGYEEVEDVLDAAHSLSVYGVDKYKKPKPLSPQLEEARAKEKFDAALDEYDAVWEKTKTRRATVELAKDDSPTAIEMFDDPQENVLYFVEKNAPRLPAWKREIIRITRKLSHYFQPQRQTKVLNEGFATFTHYYIMNRLHEKGLIDAGSMIQFYATHSNVIYQRPQSAFNPYTLGFAIFMDIKRMCEAPTDEDRHYFPNLVGKDWVEEVRYAMENFKDETFILQYLSPNVVRNLQIFAFQDDMALDDYKITEISNERSFRHLRQKLAAQYALEKLIPNVQVVGVDSKGTRKLLLKHFVRNGQPIGLEDARKVVQYLAKLWEYSVVLETIEYMEDGSEEPLFLAGHGKYSRDEDKDEDDD